MERWIILVVLGLSLAVLAHTPASQDRGAEVLNLDGGTRGKVYFPHHTHQERIEDCQVCHSLFPQDRGAVVKLKVEGRLKKKHVMNKLCVKCHREKKTAGEKTGPTTCTKCHKK